MTIEKPNMKDVAKLANVSIGTVSKYINGDTKISPDNQSRIQQAIQKLNYTPNIIARKLARGISDNLLLYIVHEYPVSTATWLYVLPIIQGISEYIKGSKYTMQIAMDPVESMPKITDFIISGFHEKSISGVIIISPWRMDNKLLLKLANSSIPYSLIGVENQLLHTNSVVMDNFGAIAMLVEHLHGLGHQSIAMINGLSGQYDMHERLRGFMDAVGRKQMTTCDEWITYGEQTMQDGFLRMKKIIESTGPKPTAVVCGNDYIAAGVIKAIQDSGAFVPRDYSVTGFDDITLSELLNPSLTTVRMPLFMLGTNGVKTVLNEIEKPGYHIAQTVLPCEVLFKKSIGPPGI